MPSQAARIDPGKAGRVLVIDDEPQVRRVLDRLLSSHGYEVLHADSGEEGLALLWSAGADTVLLDMMMPGIDGLETCRRVRQDIRTAHTPIVFLTGVADRSFRREALLAGADDFIGKPFDEIELIARVRNTVRVKLYYDGLARERNDLLRVVDDHTRDLAAATAHLDYLKRELSLARQETIERLIRASEFRDDETAAHLQRMAHYCHLIAHRKGLEDDQCETIRLASPMHDVGKIGIPDHILLKPAKLTPDEFAIMKQHAEIGYRILHGSDSSLVGVAATIAHTHHEKWDGSGYPSGLAGESIPLEGRIAAVADVFDALTSARPYKAAWTVDAAVGYMREGRGKHFDPELIDLFLGSMEDVLEIKERFRDAAPAQ